MIQFSSITLQRGEKLLFDGADLVINPGQKVGLIGANGAGKSSLFRLLLKTLTIDAGNLHVPAKWVVAHMAQEHEPTHRTALDYVIDGDFDLRAAEARLEVANRENNGEAIAREHALIESIDGYGASLRATNLILGLGFKDVDLSRSVSDFSGGWRMRLNLAHALMCRSDLLLLDEPTNHLDIDTVVWLQDWLKSYQGTLVLISHDRDFIDQTVSSIVSVEQKKLISYRGNYSSFEKQKADRLAQQQAMFEKQKLRKKEIQAFVDRFRYKASKAKQAQSRLKELERMEDIAPAHIDNPFHFTITAWEKSSSPLINVDQVSAGYPSKTLFNGLNFSLQPGQRIGLLGANGAGKSTLIKTIIGELPVLAGEIHRGEHVRVGYFAQQQLEALDLNASAFDHVMRLSPDATEAMVRNFLGGFNFQGDRVFESIRPFSGGEKTRLALALVVWQQPNILILDEPTNHLDLEMRHALTVAMQGFAGAVILVSHDRHLLANTVDEYWLVAQAKVELFDGNLDDYAQWLKQSDNSTSKAAVKKVDDKKAQRQAAAAKRQAEAPLRKRLKQLDVEIEKLTGQIKEIETTLGEGSIYLDDPAKAAHLGKEQGLMSAQLEALELEWLELSEQLEA